MSVRVFAPAKINITLQVGRPRADGYHPLQSAVMFADVGDWVEVRSARDLSLSISGPFSQSLDGDNLVLRAAQALGKRAGVTSGAALYLEKNLPVSSGIGGGSSDAAATLKALSVLWDLGFDEATLARIGSEIGADVPVCVGAKAAWMSGVGERIAPLTAPSLHAVLVNPLQGLATARVFKAFDAMNLGAGFAERAPPAWSKREDAIHDASTIGNDLAGPARSLLPVLEEIEAIMRANERVRYAGLSGSGATMFALVDDPVGADSLAVDLGRRRPEWWVKAATLT